MSAPAATKAQRVFDEEFIGRDFLNNPVDITGLRGDLYDYEFIITRTVTAAGTPQLRPTINNDTSANYRHYFMMGEGGSAAASVSDSQSYLFTNANEVGQTALIQWKLLGSSGSERYSELFHSGEQTNTRVKKGSSYWKNTADEISSIQIVANGAVATDAHIVLFATPKDSAQEEWELIRSEDFSSRDLLGNPIIFSSLNGDVDEQYKVDFRITAGTSVMNPRIRLNGDTGNNYTQQFLRNQGGTMAATNVASVDGWLPQDPGNNWPAAEGGQYTMILNALSGQERLATFSESHLSRQNENGSWWSNTGDNLTSITLDTLAAESATGTAQLYRKRTLNHTSDTLPWETVEEVEVSGDFSAGHTFSNLEGDKEFLYRLEWLGDGNGQLLIQFNADSGNNYNRQRLTATNSTVAAASSGAQDRILFVDTQGAGPVANGDAIIYPNSGEQRPLLLRDENGENSLSLRAGWWANTADEINAVKVYGSNSNVFTGTLRLSRIPRIQP